MKRFFIFLGTFLFLFVTKFAFAHEAYVLTRSEFDRGLMQTTPNAFAPLVNPAYIGVSAVITFCVVLSYLLIILWSTTSWSQLLDTIVRKAQLVGPLIIRMAISASFFYAAQANSVLGPEVTLNSVPYGWVVRFLLYLVAVMVFFGFFTEIAGLIGLGIFLYITKFYGVYMITYLNYLGELCILFLFGSRFISFDRYFFGQKHWYKKIEKLRKFETPIIRVMYGLALLYAGYNIKFLHQSLTVEVYNQYHLKDFFHADASFIAAGAGLSELAIGLFIVIGFAMRWTLLISLVFITLSLLYFHELIWPHLMLYGISFSLLINSGDFLTVDHYMVPWLRNLLYRSTRR